MFGMATSRVVMAGQRLSLFKELASGPATPEELAARCGLILEGTDHLLKCLAALGYLALKPEPQGLAALDFDNPSNGRYSLTRRARKWLVPSSTTYIGDFLEFNYDQWDWWAKLEDVVRAGESHDIHDYPPDDPRWRRYITAMFQLARLSAPEVARKLPLPSNPRRILDLAGGHGWFAAEICKRHPGLNATVIDLPGSVAIGSEIIARAGMNDRVKFTEGDILQDNFAGSYDGALCFQIVHHFTPEQNLMLFQKVHAAVKPGGTFVVLDYFPPTHPGRPDSSAFLGMHFYLTSGAAAYRRDEIEKWLTQAGFLRPKRIRLRSMPVQELYVSEKA